MPAGHSPQATHLCQPQPASSFLVFLSFKHTICSRSAILDDHCWQFEFSANRLLPPRYRWRSYRACLNPVIQTFARATSIYIIDRYYTSSISSQLLGGLVPHFESKDRPLPARSRTPRETATSRKDSHTVTGLNHVAHHSALDERGGGTLRVIAIPVTIFLRTPCLRLEFVRLAFHTCWPASSVTIRRRNLPWPDCPATDVPIKTAVLSLSDTFRAF